MAFPGAQVLIIHKNKTLIHKAYGYHTYDHITPVDTTHLYDLASVTKVMGGGLALMKLQEKGKFNPNMLLKETHPSFKNTDKADFTWQSILAHQAKLKPYIVFWQTAKRKNGRYKWRTFSYTQNKYNNIQIDDEIFLHRRYARKIEKLIKKSPLNSEAKYLYSGLGFLLIPDFVERTSGMPLDQFLKKEVYEPLDLDRITFQPSKYFPLEEIVPTEIDTFFRHKLVHGYVHDENASMLNGVSTNAGLFSNARSLGTIGEALLAKDDKIFDHQIVAQYTSVQFPENDNRRGLVFDKPMLTYKAGSSYVAESASPSSFGHSGFTGTFIWMDPEYDLIVIFLSNRVYPYRSNRKLYSMNFRPDLQQLAYDYLLKNKN
ncbi:hypothetical protein GCM10007940_01380 [Portibacter lacus]|uniref:Beta-lactamase-related domain-containing protein n=2 Tax=Portibacter lacus TaxID=1099794 RepID=A0AA37WBY4_9BACT|nr:hypothetical protein GCM10007940_01380 [Portibacter lacus]